MGHYDYAKLLFLQLLLSVSRENTGVLAASICGVQRKKNIKDRLVFLLCDNGVGEEVIKCLRESYKFETGGYWS